MSQEQRRPRPTPEPRTASVNSVLSIAVAVLAVLLGFFILRDLRNDSGIAATDPGSIDESAPQDTTVETLPVETTMVPVVLTGFKVQIANGSGISGSAGLLTTEMQGRGYLVQPAINKSEVTPKQTVTIVYYLLGSEAPAAQVARDLGGVATLPMPTPIPTETASLGEASVLILLGTDLAGKPLSIIAGGAVAPPVVVTTTTTG
ncbi:MAG: LytR C-terminal domain-containing protein [Ilumatobacteraceae bacterium]|nr:LytR C-terminal domain-containing protein [Ilumatobacteraceae bacterium]